MYMIRYVCIIHNVNKLIRAHPCDVTALLKLIISFKLKIIYVFHKYICKMYML